MLSSDKFALRNVETFVFLSGHVLVQIYYNFLHNVQNSDLNVTMIRDDRGMEGKKKIRNPWAKNPIVQEIQHCYQVAYCTKKCTLSMWFFFQSTVLFFKEKIEEKYEIAEKDTTKEIHFLIFFIKIFSNKLFQYHINFT